MMYSNATDRVGEPVAGLCIGWYLKEILHEPT